MSKKVDQKFGKKPKNYLQKQKKRLYYHKFNSNQFFLKKHQKKKVKKKNKKKGEHFINNKKHCITRIRRIPNINTSRHITRNAIFRNSPDYQTQV